MFINIACYLYYGRSQKSYVNALTPVFLIGVPSLYILELLYIYYNGSSATVEAYWFVYLAYALSSVITAFVLIRVKVPKILTEYRPPAYDVKYAPYMLLIVSFLLYLPILLEFAQYITNPRNIYYLTRTGYGLNSFASSLASNFAFILILFKKRSCRMERIGFFILCAIQGLLHGSKGQVITIVFIWLLHYVYIQNKRVRIMRFVFASVIFSFVLTGLFYFLSTDPDLAASSLLRNLSGYSDYSRNAMMVIDNDLPPLWGKLNFEDAVYSRIPRVLFPDKPKDFGTFYLAKLYFPEWFAADTGSPAFGVGVVYADFKSASLLYLVITSFVSAWLLKIFISRSERFHDPGDFIMLLFLSGVVLIPLGVGYLLPEHFLLAVVISFMLRLRLFRRTK
jgi:hypothetical protein